MMPLVGRNVGRCLGAAARGTVSAVVPGAFGAPNHRAQWRCASAHRQFAADAIAGGVLSGSRGESGANSPTDSYAPADNDALAVNGLQTKWLSAAIPISWKSLTWCSSFRSLDNQRAVRSDRTQPIDP